MGEDLNSLQSNNKNRKTFFRTIYIPFITPIKHGRSTFIWFLFTLLASFVGTIANCIIRYSIYGLTVKQSLYVDSASGSFYVMAIVLLASLLGPLFINFIENRNIEHRNIKIHIVSLIIFILFFAGIFYSVCNTPQELCEKAKDMEIGVDVVQLIFIVIAVVLAYYCYGIQKLDEYTYMYPELQDTYEAKENNNVGTVIKGTDEMQDDGNNIEL